MSEPNPMQIIKGWTTPFLYSALACPNLVNLELRLSAHDGDVCLVDFHPLLSHLFNWLMDNVLPQMSQNCSMTIYFSDSEAIVVFFLSLLIYFLTIINFQNEEDGSLLESWAAWMRSNNFIAHAEVEENHEELSFVRRDDSRVKIIFW